VKSSKARGKILLAIDRLAAEKPLHAGILGRWRLVEDSSISTMAVGFRSGRLTLYFCPAFVESITLDELVGVVEHECNHVLLGHVFHESPPNEHHENARTAAEEITSNEFVSHPLPGNPITLSDYPSLPANEDTETRHEALKSIVPEDKIITIDEHTRWDEILAGGQLASAVVAVVIAQTWDNLSPEERAKINMPPAIQKLVQKARQSAGSSVIGTGTASVPWQKVLRRYVGRSVSRRPVFGRVPRRFPEMVGVLPGRGRQGSKPRIMAVIDTSGSMTPAILADISAELAVMAKSYEVLVVECDTEVRSVYRYRPIVELHGRGGTDFRPPLESSFLKKHKPDLVIFFSDGHGKAPSEAPRGVPVIWAITPRGRKPTAWGREVRL
jgi:predicted metal-dependent peptidase